MFSLHMWFVWLFGLGAGHNDVDDGGDDWCFTVTFVHMVA